MLGSVREGCHRPGTDRSIRAGPSGRVLHRSASCFVRSVVQRVRLGHRPRIRIRFLWQRPGTGSPDMRYQLVRCRQVVQRAFGVRRSRALLLHGHGPIRDLQNRTTRSARRGGEVGCQRVPATHGGAMGKGRTGGAVREAFPLGRHDFAFQCELLQSNEYLFLPAYQFRSNTLSRTSTGWSKCRSNCHTPPSCTRSAETS